MDKDSEASNASAHLQNPSGRTLIFQHLIGADAGARSVRLIDLLPKTT
jgi:hypothetical protein